MTQTSPSSPSRRYRLGTLFVVVALDMVGFGMVVPLLPLYAQRFGIGGTQVALLFAAYSLMQFIFAPLWGQLSDRVGRRPVLLASIAGNALAWLLCAFAPTFSILLAARIMAGMCTANVSVAQAYIADITPAATRAQGMGFIGAAFGLGFVVGPFAGGELSRLGEAAPALCAAALTALNALVAYFTLSESLPAALRQRGSASVFAQRFALVRQHAARADVLTLIFVQITAFTMMEMSLVLFAKLRLGFDAARAGRAFAYIGVVLVVVQGGALRKLTSKLGEPLLVRAGMFAMALGLCGVPFVGATNWQLLLLPLTLLAVGQALCQPCLGSLLSRHASPQLQGAVMGVGQSVSALARTVGPALGGWAYDTGGIAAPFFLGCLWMAVGTLLAIVWLRPAAAPAQADR